MVNYVLDQACVLFSIRTWFKTTPSTCQTYLHFHIQIILHIYTKNYYIRRTESTPINLLPYNESHS